MTNTLQYKVLGSLATFAFILAITPLAFAAENGATGWETRASDKIELAEELLVKAEALVKGLDADDEDTAEARKDLSEIIDDVTEAREYFAAGDYRDAYKDAADAYKDATMLMRELNNEALKKNKDAAKEKREARNRELAEQRDAAKTRAQGGDCDDNGRCVRPDAKQKAVCDPNVVTNTGREARFCRNGEWKEKRDARLDDITAGFVEAADLDEDETVAIRAEIEALIRQLITLIMMSRLGN